MFRAFGISPSGNACATSKTILPSFEYPRWASAHCRGAAGAPQALISASSLTKQLSPTHVWPVSIDASPMVSLSDWDVKTLSPLLSWPRSRLAGSAWLARCSQCKLCPRALQESRYTASHILCPAAAGLPPGVRDCFFRSRVPGPKDLITYLGSTMASVADAQSALMSTQLSTSTCTAVDR